MNAIVSFEKNANGVTKVTKIRRENAPGMIEKQENLRAENIERQLNLRCKIDRNAWYNAKVL